MQNYKYLNNINLPNYTFKIDEIKECIVKENIINKDDKKKFLNSLERRHLLYVLVTGQI